MLARSTARVVRALGASSVLRGALEAATRVTGTAVGDNLIVQRTTYNAQRWGYAAVSPAGWAYWGLGWSRAAARLGSSGREATTTAVAALPFALRATLMTTPSTPTLKDHDPGVPPPDRKKEEEAFDDSEDDVFQPNDSAPHPEDRAALEAALAAFASQVYPTSEVATVPMLATSALEEGADFVNLGCIPGVPYAVPTKDVFGVVQISNHLQHKVTPNDFLYVQPLKKVDVGDKLVFSQVLLLGSVKESVIGRPFVPGAAVVAVVEQQTRDAHGIVFKKKRRKNYRRKTGFRTELTQLRILDIVGMEE